jgi:beta-glucosidase
MIKRASFAIAVSVFALASSLSAAAAPDNAQPWLNPKLSPDKRAALAVAAMTEDEMYTLVRGYVGISIDLPGMPKMLAPEGARQSSGYVPGIPRLGISALYETDASMGVSNMFNMRLGDSATAFPATLILAATFNPELAYKVGATIGVEAHSKGYNVLLGGGVNLTRELRNGRNFEYLGEDPLLSGIMGGEAVRGTQSQHVISTVKHFALNAQSTNQNLLDAQIDKGALRESDLLAFQIAIERGQPGAVMCSYNKINGAPACNNSWLLNDVLKSDWSYKGWVMSDWSATKSAEFALNGMDQQSGSQMDLQPWFDKPLRKLLAKEADPKARLREMATRIVRSMFQVGIIDVPATKRAIDVKANAQVALDVAHQGIILLKNEGNILPLPATAKKIAVIGGFANIGVPTGGGSSQVAPSNGKSVQLNIAGPGFMGMAFGPILLPSSPYDALVAAYPRSQVNFDTGFSAADAALTASKAEVAIVFVTRHATEGLDSVDLTLPFGQDALVSAVAKANPNTIVVVLSGNPVTMPWAGEVKAIVAGFMPGQEGGKALADILTGVVNPSGRLPITFPASLSQLPFPVFPNAGVEPFRAISVNYHDGSDVGYRWYARNATPPLFAFGHGLSYTKFGYTKLSVKGGKTVSVSFDVTNTGARVGADVPQLYLTSAAGEKTLRLVGFQRVELKPGERKTVRLDVDPRLMAHFDEASKAWQLKAGDYAVSLGRSSFDLDLKGQARVAAQTIRP